MEIEILMVVVTIIVIVIGWLGFCKNKKTRLPEQLSLRQNQH